MENEYLNQSYINMTNKQSEKKQGTLNPMYSRTHSSETKQKISKSQKQRWRLIKQAIKENLGQTDNIARYDLLRQALETDTISFRDVQQARNFVTIMTGEDKKLLEDYLRPIVDEVVRCYLEHV
ncbi:hypothetical protein DUT93_21300 [Bacteroides xylanisolvens]|uniref:NUMOD3 domain-containing DNA-binding protein n=1 Tax=Bacteroides xylanisolvens TaxID=371601 RepID=UPI0021D1AB8B|nr:NUMOD3 domain-containing DNA-binding protein [Bacteroides xylanisolvens]MCU4242583.1 hypothetical protein [Bacteroides xylanisolvens]